MRVVLGTPINAVPKPWHYFKVKSVMINAWELRGLKVGVRNALEFEGEIWVDSGGYQHLRRGIEVSINDVIKLYRKHPDAQWYMVLDYPPSPRDPPDLVLKKVEATRRNYEYMRANLRGLNIVPVVHYNPHLKPELLAEMYDGVESVAVGGLVPYVLISRGVQKRSRERALEFLVNFRESTSAKVHVLGLGSPSVVPILELIGAETTDTVTWRLKAAYGKVVLPGGGERHVTSREVKFGKSKAAPEDIAMLEDYLRRTGFPLIATRSVYELLEKFETRALVNAWVVLTSREPPRSSAFRRLYDFVKSSLAYAEV